MVSADISVSIMPVVGFRPAMVTPRVDQGSSFRRHHRWRWGHFPSRLMRERRLSVSEFGRWIALQVRQTRRTRLASSRLIPPSRGLPRHVFAVPRYCYRPSV